METFFESSKNVFFFIFQVNIQYPSKTVHKVIHDEWRAKVIRQVAAKEDEMAVRNVLEQKELEECVLQRVEKSIQKECKDLCGRRQPSLLRATSPDSLIKLTDIQLNEEVRTRAPTLHRFLGAAALNERSQWKAKAGIIKGEKSANANNDQSIPAVSMASSLLLRARCPEMSANAYRFSTLLWHASCEKQVFFGFL